jgi:hypothetical protein
VDFIENLWLTDDYMYCRAPFRPALLRKEVENWWKVPVDNEINDDAARSETLILNVLGNSLAYLIFKK